MRVLAPAVLLLVGCASIRHDARPIDPTEVTSLSKRYLERVDAFDAAAVEALTATEFVRASRVRLYPRQQVLAGLVAKVKLGFPKVLSRTFEDERVRSDGDTALFTAITKTHSQVDAAGKTVDAESTCTMVWVREPDGWRLLNWEAQDAGAEAERSNWNEFFRQSSGFNLKPNKFLVEVSATQKPGKALDIGVGQGRNALYLASKGWAVTGVDISDEGIRQTQAAAEAAQLKVDARLADANTFNWGVAQWDLICLIYEGGGQYVAKVVEALKPGGIVVLEYFHQDATQGNGAGGFKSNEVPELFKALKTVRYEEVEDIADYSLRPQKLVRYVGMKQ